MPRRKSTSFAALLVAIVLSATFLAAQPSEATSRCRDFREVQEHEHTKAIVANSSTWASLGFISDEENGRFQIHGKICALDLEPLGTRDIRVHRVERAEGYEGPVNRRALESGEVSVSLMIEVSSNDGGDFEVMGIPEGEYALEVESDSFVVFDLSTIPSPELRTSLAMTYD